MYVLGYYPFYLLLMGFLALTLAVYSLRKSPKASGNVYSALMLFMVFFLVTLTAAELLAESFQTMLLLRNAQQLPIFLSVVFLLAIVREHLGKSAVNTRKMVQMMCFSVMVYAALVFTDQWHHLMRQSVDIQTFGSLSEIVVTPTFMNLFFIACYYFTAASAVTLLVANMRNFSNYVRGNHFLLLTGTLIPVFVPLLFTVTEFTVPGILAVSYTLAGLFVYAAFFRYQLMSVWPVAKDRIFEQMNDGIVMADYYDRVVEMNREGRKVLDLLFSGDKKKDWIGAGMSEFFKEGTSLAEAYGKKTESAWDLTLSAGEEFVYYDVSFIPVESSVKTRKAMLIIFTNITDKKKFEQELLLQASTDSLTGLFNRRYFLKLFNEHVQNKEAGKPDALILLDIDDFKIINDTFGHQAGDEVLAQFAARLVQFFMADAIAGRVGGEEFAVLLKGVNASEAWDAADLFRRQMAAEPLVLKSGDSLVVEMSAGVASSGKGNMTFEELHKAADDALYRAKNSGKKSVATHSGSA